MKPNEIITSKFIEALGRGDIPWRKGWEVSFDFRNAISRKPYNGVNILILAMLGKGESHFTTYKGAVSMGGNVRKGEKGIPVVFYKRLEVDDPATGRKKTIPLLRYYTVFGMAQTEGCKWTRPESGKREFDPVAEAETLIDYLPQGDIVYDGFDCAYYNLADKKIHLPKRADFFGKVEFYATLFHEIGHYLGDRAGDVQTGDKRAKEYAREELCAEIFACFALNHLGLLADCTFDNSAAYVNHWISRLQSDPNLIIWAASRASKRLATLLGEAPEPSPDGAGEGETEGAELAGVA